MDTEAPLSRLIKGQYEAMMSDRRALYRRASFFEQRRPLICDMLCSSITRRSPSTCTRLVCLPFAGARSRSHRDAHAHSAFSLWKLILLVHRILAAFVVFFSLRYRKSCTTLSLFPLVLSYCTGITNGYFNWNFWHCLHLALEEQTSEWLAKQGPG